MAAIALAGASTGMATIAADLRYGIPTSTLEWRPFTTRRTIGGDLVRSVVARSFAGALRYGPVHIPFDIVEGTTITGYPVGYDTTVTTVQIPPTYPWRRAALVRGGFGYPNSPLDGEAIWYYANDTDGWVQPTEQFNYLVHDEPLTEGRWYYYTLFVYVGENMPGQWVVGATTEILVPKDYGHADLLFEMIPYHYRSVDARQAADGINGPLKKFTAVIGYDADYNRTLCDGILDIYDTDRAPLQFVEQLGANLGMPIEEALGGARYRSLVGRLWTLDGMRGTTPGLQAFVYAASNYECGVHNGSNNLLTVDDSEFLNGPGHWAPLTNSISSSFVNIVPAPDTVPTTTTFTNLVTRKYTGASAAIPSVPGSAGRGVLEVIETTATPVLVDFIVSAGVSQTGVTNGISDGIQFGIPVNGGELWEFGFWMCHKTGDVNAQVIGTFLAYDLKGTPIPMMQVNVAFPSTGYVADSNVWTHYNFQHIIGTDNDGLSGTGPVGYIIPTIWWHSAAGAIKSRYIMGAMVTNIAAVGGDIKPLPPDIFLVMGDAGPPARTLGSDKAHLGYPNT